MHTKIIVNADDFGATSSINHAIITLMNAGVVNSSTLMANMDGFEEAVDLTFENGFSEKIGIHLVLTEGFPLTNEIRALRFFFNKSEFTFRRLIKRCFFLSAHEQGLIYKEFAAQIEKVQKTGIQITHLDTHNQVHDMWPIMKIMVELLKVYNIPGMRILNNLERSKYFYKNVYRKFCVAYLKGLGINFSDFMGNQNDFIANMRTNSCFLLGKTVEIMVHPDYNNNGEIIDKIGKMQHDFSFCDSFLDTHLIPL